MYSDATHEKRTAGTGPRKREAPMTARTLAIALAALLASALLSGCAMMRSTEVPMPAQYHAGLGANAAHGLIVFLPGFGDTPAHFQKNGLIDAVREVAPGWDMVAVDAHFGYYDDRQVEVRLREDIIGPATTLGYQEIWLVGVSMGGLGSLGYATANTADVTGLILLAPFMGPNSLIEEITGSGGLAAWQPGDVASMKEGDTKYYREVWAWLRGYALGDPRPELFIGWGDGDRLKKPAAILAKELPPEKSLEMKGGHTWTVWLTLFQELAGRALKR